MIGIDIHQINLRCLLGKSGGCILKDESPEILINAIRIISQSTVWLSHAVEKQLQQQNENSLIPTQRYGLTKREVEVLRYMTDGLSNKEIARLLVVTERTVEFHVTNILQKLNVVSRVAAVLWAKEYV